MSDSKPQPLLFCVVGPAGCGKSSICRAVLRNDSSLILSISTTTRSPRPTERDSIDYFFVAESEFRERIASGNFLEHAEFNHKLYGTERRNLDRARERSADLLLDIEVQGVRQLKQSYRGSLITVFVFPPSFEILEARLRARATETEESIQNRLRIARTELAVLSSPGFADYFVCNDSLEHAVADLAAIVRSERLRASRSLPTF